MPRNITSDEFQHTRTKNDPLPHVQAAGIRSYSDKQHASQCLHSSVPEQSNHTLTATQTITDPTALQFLPFSQQYKKQPALQYIHGITNNKDYSRFHY